MKDFFFIPYYLSRPIVSCSHTAKHSRGSLGGWDRTEEEKIAMGRESKKMSRPHFIVFPRRTHPVWIQHEAGVARTRSGHNKLDR